MGAAYSHAYSTSVGWGRKNRQESSVSRSDRPAQTDMCYQIKLSMIEHDWGLNAMMCPDNSLVAMWSRDPQHFQDMD